MLRIWRTISEYSPRKSSHASKTFHHSFRKRLSQKPKFYYFDLGVTRALSRLLSVPLTPGTSSYGDAFEHFIILECVKLGAYFKSEYRFSYLKTKDHVEVDLIIERPGLPILFVEIKSSKNVRADDLNKMLAQSSSFRGWSSEQSGEA